jgi:hypothetical protein
MIPTSASRSVALLTGLAALAMTGCKSPCDGFNPFREYDRVKNPSKDTGETEKVLPYAEGNFYLACWDTSSDEQTGSNDTKTAIEEALKGGGAGASATLVTDEAGIREAMLTFARSEKGPFRDQLPYVTRFEASFTLKSPLSDLQMSQPMSVRWKGGRTEREIELNNADKPGGTFIPLGEGIFQVILEPTSALRVPGADLLRRGDGYTLTRTHFDLVVGGQVVQLDHVNDQTVVVKPARLLVFKIDNFHGDTSAFLCELLREKRPLGTGKMATFTLKQAFVYLDSAIEITGSDVTWTARWEQPGAPGKPEGVQVTYDGGGGGENPAEPEPGKPKVVVTFDEENNDVARIVITGKGEKPAVVKIAFKLGGADQTAEVPVQAAAAGP